MAGSEEEADDVAGFFTGCGPVQHPPRRAEPTQPNPTLPLSLSRQSGLLFSWEIERVM